MSALANLTQEVADLRRQVAAGTALDQGRAAVQSQSQAQTGAPPRRLAGFEGGKFFLQSEEGDYRLTLGGRVHFHGIFPVDGPSENDHDIVVRRIRTVIEGHLARHYQFKIEYDFGRERQALTDGFINLAHIPEAQLRAGKYKVPFSAEELTSSNSIRFVERSVVSRTFAPSRLIGASLHGGTGALRYEAGIFDGSQKGHFLYAGRVTVTPLSGLTLGANAFHEHNQDRNLNGLSYSTELGTRFFQYASGTSADKNRTSYGADLSFWGTPFGFLAEYLATRQDALVGGNSRKLTHDGWLVQASYVLTGENATARGVTPRNDFNPAQGGWGAVELVARYACVNFDSRAFPTFATAASVEDVTAISGGVNWYLNRNVRMILNYAYNRFDEKIAGDKVEHGLLARLQLAF